MKDISLSQNNESFVDFKMNDVNSKVEQFFNDKTKVLDVKSLK
jgi:hypothetical protein